jgi:hypothetical protein
MPLSCPVCTKPNQDGPACQRCGCDLSALHMIRRAAEACLAEARHSLRDQQWGQALIEAERSWELCHSPEAARCAFVLAAALGETAAALHWRQRALQDPTAGRT